MGLTQDFAGSIEPDDPDWLRADSPTKRRYYEAGGPVVLDELAKQLGRGIGHNGRAMRVRIQPVLDDGADGPVMEPHYSASRVITLADWSATDHSLKLWWHAGTGHRQHRRARKIGRKAPPFGTILAWHADGEVPHCPVRDVRLCPQRVRNVKRRLEPVWKSLKRRAKLTPEPRTTPQKPGPRQPTPPTRPTPPTPPSRLPRVDKPHEVPPEPHAHPTPAPQAPRAPRAPAAPPYVEPPPTYYTGQHPTPTHPIPVHGAVPRGRVTGPIFVITGGTRPRPAPAPRVAPPRPIPVPQVRLPVPRPVTSTRVTAKPKPAPRPKPAAAPKPVPAPKPAVPEPVTFGPSTARVLVDNASLRELKRMTGRDFTPQDVASLVGATHDASVNAYASGDRVYVTIQSPRYHSNRTIKMEAGLPIIHNDLLVVERAHRGAGLGAQILGRQVEHASKWGFDRLETDAARSDGPDGYVGYYAWPRLGYNAPIPRDIKAKVAAVFPDAVTVRDLMLTKERQDWWKEHGVWTNGMIFRLQPGAESMLDLQVNLNASKTKKKSK